jgi:hypothetical protein
MSTTNILESPNVKTGSYAERQAKKLERKAILCLQCSTDTEQVYHSVKKATEWVPEKKVDPAESEDQRAEIDSHFLGDGCPRREGKK